MPSSTSVQPWNLNLPAGSYQAWNFSLTIAGTLLPFPLAATSWEYVVRTTQTDTGAPLIRITTAPSASGLITVTASTGTVLLEIYAAATAALAPGTYYHTLWMNQGLTDAVAWVTGPFIVTGNPQP